MNLHSTGYTRIKWGRGFSYFNCNGERIKDKEKIDYFKSLAIPPSWKSVWINESKSGKLLAHGRDKKNRKQYIYSDSYLEEREAEKYSKLNLFGKVLPEIRARNQRLLKKPTASKKYALGVALEILDNIYIRVGHLHYLNENGTHGLTTLKNRHLNFSKGEVSLEYKAKTGQKRFIQLTDQKISDHLKKAFEVESTYLFSYRDSDGQSCRLSAADINKYLSQFDFGNHRFTAKDFRTWGANVLALEFSLRKKRKDNPEDVVKAVGQKMGHTSRVCQDAYIHPAINELLEKKIKLPRIEGTQQNNLAQEERLLISLLNSYESS